MYLVLYDQKIPNIVCTLKDCSTLDISDVLDYPVGNNLKDISEKDFYPNEICKLLDTLESPSPNAIIIVLGGRFTWLLAQRLACHIRFHHFIGNIDNLPIIITYKDKPDLLHDKNLVGAGDIQNFQYEDGFFFKSIEELWVITKNEFGEDCLYLEKFYQEVLKNKTYSSQNLKVLEINSKEMGDRHSIANEWGAVKLALNAGYGLDEINYTFPPTLYFNYLIKKYGIKTDPSTDKINFSHLLRKRKVLLVDDNSDKGWQASLEKIFEPANVDVADDFEKVNQFGNLKDLSPYDLIFLDLRLPKIQKNDIEYDHGKNLLKKIKKSYPQIPVIVFTASNKSRTLDEVREKGADGMYVKDSPEYAGDVNYSIENFKNFTKSVIDTLEKYKVLRPYWEAIQKILDDNTFLSIREKENSKFKERIRERFMMFYGLLKRGFEETDFNRNKFHFSDYELAFMTLWSVLNEIQEFSFIKEPIAFPIQDTVGKTYHHHPNKSLDISDSLENWFYVLDGTAYINYYVELDSSGVPIETINSKTKKSSGYFDFKFYTTFEQIMVRDTESKQWVERSPFFQFNKNLQSNTPLKVYKEKISLQIAFIIEKLNPSSKERFHSSLIKLNKIRNHLYLTHGSEMSSGFYNQTEKAKRDDHTIKPDGDIKDLFELTSFLLTGKENQVDIQ